MQKKLLSINLLLATSVIFMAASCSSPTTNSSPSNQDANIIAPVTKSPNNKLVKNIKGKISGYDFNAYHFTAQKGQVLTLTLSTNGNVEPFLFGYDDYRYGQPYVLPETADYEVRVVQPRNSARKNKTAEYDLMIEVK